MAILITGGAGFIGSNLAKALVIKGYEVIIYDNFWRNAIDLIFHDSPQLYEKIKIIKGDILDIKLLKEVLFKYRIEYVFHLAAIAGVDTVLANPILTFKTNLIGSVNILDILVEYFEINPGVLKRVVLFSTSEVFGEYVFHPEEIKPIFGGIIGEIRWNYAVSKLAEEHIAMTYYKVFGLPVVIVRPFNIYGPGQVGDSAMKSFILRALKNEVIKIHGDGSQIRAWCYIDDMIDALIAIINRDISVGNVFNIGNPKSSLSIYNLVFLIKELLNSKSVVEFTDIIYNDVALRVPSILKAKEILDFNPKIDLKEGIINTANFYKKFITKF